MYPQLFINLFVDKLVCDTCRLAKSKRQTYPSVDDRCLAPIRLIHCDVWGPSPHIDTNGFRWFLICVDNHSRFCWVYLMKHKAEVARILKNLCQSIKRQFGVNVQGFRTDNAKDFCNNELREFFEQEGIRHETSCTYTPQQNGLAERKIGDIMDKFRTLTEQSQLPKTLWSLSVMTYVHLINRLPTNTVKMKSPIEVLEQLFPKARLNNNLTPRVFGCVSYVHLHGPSVDKFSVNALKCVFIGYSNTQKGYKCYYPPTRKIVITKDVTFDENRFYYQSNTELQEEQEVIRREIRTPLPLLSPNEEKD